MITVSFQFHDDAEATELLNEFCYRMQRPEQVDNPAFDPQIPIDPETNPTHIPNPETKLQFWKKAVLKWSSNVAADGLEMRNKAQNRARFDGLNVS